MTDVASAAIEQFFIDQYKIDFGIDLLNNAGQDGRTTEERLALFREWEPNYGQRAQAEANAIMILERLEAAGIAVTPEVYCADNATTYYSGRHTTTRNYSEGQQIMSNEFNPVEPEFVSWGKIPRLFRNVVVTEKIDGTNAAIGILDDGRVYAQSRKKLITPEQDNAGFARWVAENEDALRYGLGPGLHFGEWWGRGVQRGYGMDGKRFSLFNTSRWGGLFATNDADGYADVEVVNDLHDAGVRVVPVLYSGPFSEFHIKSALTTLEVQGSQAAPGFMDPEGIIIFHTAANSMFKVTLVGDEKPKGSTE